MEELHSYDEILLFRQIAGGDEQAFTIIFHRYTAKLYPVIFSLTRSETDAREVIQEVFIKYWLNRDQLTHMSNPGGWLYTVAVNHTYDFLKAKGVYQARLQQAPVPEGNDNVLELELDAKYTKALIDEAVRQLPERRRQVFEMARLQGYSRKQIAGKLEISENTVRNQLAEAVSFVQDYLQKHASLYIPAILISLHTFQK